MSVSLNEVKLTKTALSAIAIMAGVSVANTSKQMGVLNSKHGVIGGALFVGGWYFMSQTLSQGASSQVSLAINASVLMILSAVAIQKASALKFNTKGLPNALMPVLFMLGWVLLGAMLYKKNPTSKYKLLGPVSAAWGLASMTKILPEQRKLNLVDGPGHSMFALAWGMITLLNSAK